MFEKSENHPFIEVTVKLTAFQSSRNIKTHRLESIRVCGGIIGRRFGSNINECSVTISERERASINPLRSVKIFTRSLAYGGGEKVPTDV